MKREKVFEDVSVVLQRILVLDHSEVKEDSILSTDLGADDLDQVEIAMSIEKELDIYLDDNVFLHKAITVKELVDHVMEMLD